MLLNKSVITQYISQLIAEKLAIESSEVKLKQPLFDIGVSSLVSEEILMALGKSYAKLSTTFLFEYPTIDKIATHLAQQQPRENAPILLAFEKGELTAVAAPDVAQSSESEDKPQVESNHPVIVNEPVAIIGVSGKFPQADNPLQLFNNLLDNLDSVTEVPEHRWDAKAMFSEDNSDRSAIFSKWGGFIDDIEYFDPMLFQIPHREAELMDPQQKLFLQCGWALMEDAGYGDPQQRPSDNIGVYAGVTWNEFSLLAHDASLEQDSYKGAGSLYWSIPNRLSYVLNLKGPSVAIDSACSSSLVAVHDACTALQTGSCDMAIAGGVNLNLHPDKYLFLSQNHFLSSEGKCRSFGEGGDGYVPGEGVAAILLRPLSQAQDAGDHIYGVIKAATTNHGGKVTGYTVPNPAAHTTLIGHAIERSGVNVEDISYIECHGTGTDLGDPIEITGLTNAFAKASDNKGFCAIGSVKSNIGHLEAAAGITGLIKILLAMKHQQLPASLHSEVENKKLDLAATPFYLVKKNQPWGAKGERLVAGVSSFGAGGSNAHVIVENYPQHDKLKLDNKTVHAVVLSADSQAQLKQSAKSLQQAVGSSIDHHAYSVGDLAYTLLMGRSEFRHRVVILAKNFSDVDKGLKAFLAGKVKAAKTIFVGELKGPVNDEIELSKAQINKLNITKWAQLWAAGQCPKQAYLQLKTISGKDYRRLSLPSYPFLKERSWITEGYPLASRSLNTAKVEDAGKPALHPLIDSNISTLYEQKFEKTFDVQEFVLKDHLVNEVHVIPGVCHLEMIRKCASEATEEAVKVIKDVWYSNVITVPDRRTVHVELSVDDDNLSYQVQDAQTDTIFSRGKVGWQTSAPVADITKLDPQAIAAQLDTEWPIKSVYEKFVLTGIIQKESFQVLNKIQFSRTQCLSKLVLPGVLDEQFEQFVFHPALMDGMVQTAMMHVQFLLGEDVKILPFHFSQVTFVAPLEREVYVHCQVIDEPNNQFDLIIYNMAGEPLVKVDSFILKAMVATTAIEEQVAPQAAQIFPTYYSPKWVEMAPKPASEEAKTILVLCGNNSYGEFSGNDKVIVAKASDQFIENNDEFELRYDNAGDYLTLVNRLAVREQLPQLVIYATSDDNCDIDHRLNMAGKSLFLLNKALLSKVQQLDLVVFADEREAGKDTANMAAVGFFKTLKVEKPGYNGRVIVLDHGLDNGSALSQLVAYAKADIATQKGVLTSCYRQQQRYYSRYENLIQADADEAKASGRVVVREQGHYLITGGMGGIGLVFARHLIDQYDASVYLTGRSAMDDKKQQALDLLTANGKGKAEYISCDVNDHASVERCINQIGELNGIIHSAGTIEDSFILRKDLDSFERVITPKVHGSLNLDLATKDSQLDFFCLFSSVTAIMGNLGQCDYGYANAFEDHFVAQRNRLSAQGERHGKALSVNWPYWKNGGMQLTDAQEQQLLNTFGFTPLGNENGVEAMLFGLASSVSQIAVLEGDQAKIQQMLRTFEEVKAGQEQQVTAAVDDELMANTCAYLVEIFAEELKIPKERIETGSSFERYGFDSIVMIDLINVMEKKFGSLPKTLFFEYQTIDELAGYFSANHAEHFSSNNSPAEQAEEPSVSPLPVVESQAPAKSKKSRFATKAVAAASTPSAPTATATLVEVPMAERKVSEQNIAIIGLAGRYPQADTLEQYWDNLVAGKDSVVEIPDTLWDVTEHFKAGKQQAGKSYSKWGGFVDNVDRFDAKFFNITPKEAQVTDPQERLFLEVATSAIEDAGYTADKLAGPLSEDADSKDNPVGVFVGVMWGDYQLFGVTSEDSAAWTTPRSFYWGIANRVSYFHNFSGPSMAVDSACSSSLSAIHLGCESLRNGESKVVIAGGVNLTLHPNKYNLLSEMQFLSTDGRCRSFGEGGDGYVPGDGVGAVILKPLSTAQADGDNIYGVIRGSALNHGGKASGFTVPNPIRQAALIKSAMKNAGVSPRHISYVEAHGTGTSLGDPVEMIGLKKAYQQQDNQYCAIGSVKANIGHLEAAAGIAALTKILLQLKHQKLVPSLHSQTLNPNIDFSQTPFKVQQQLEDWNRPRFIDENQQTVEIPRLAGLSSFGAGGSNAHVIIEEYVAAKDVEQATETDGKKALLFSAKNPEALKQMLSNFAAFIDKDQQQLPSLASMAYTLQTGREAFNLRCVVIADSVTQLAKLLQTYLQSDSINGPDIEAEDGSVIHGDLGRKNTLTSLFLQSTDSNTIVENWYQQNAQDQLAVAWVNGIDVDWSRLYQQPKPNKASLPGYVYQSERFWTRVPQAGSSFVALHPLLDRNVSTMQRQLFSKSFSDSDLLLNEHRLHQQKTLPGSAYLTMALQAALHSSEVQLQANEAVQFDNVVWAKPITVNGEPTKAQIELAPYQRGFAFEIAKSLNGGTDSNWQPCAQGELSFTAMAPSSERIDVDVLVNSHHSINKANLYSHFGAIGYEFGTNFDIYAQLTGGQDSAVSIINISEEGDEILSAIGVDAIFRTSLLVGVQGDNDMAQVRLEMPINLSRARVYGKLSGSCVVHSRLVEANAQQRRYDIDVYNGTGQLIAIFYGFVTAVVDSKPVPKPVQSQVVETNDSSFDLVCEYLASQLSEVSEIAISDIAFDVPMEQYGIDSVMIMGLNDKLELTFGELSKTLFYEYQDIQSLARFFVDNHQSVIAERFTPAKQVVAPVATAVEAPTTEVEPLVSLVDFGQYRNTANKTAQRVKEQDIAVIGMSGRFPEADSVEQLWQVLAEGQDCIKEIPLDRWDHRDFYQQGTIEPGKSSGKWGGFINGFNQFDAPLFNILPSQAKSMDPQERLFLESVWATLEDGGYTAHQLANTVNNPCKVGVFAGSMWNQYGHVGLEQTLKGNPTMTYAWDASIANRASYYFNFNGPSMTFDTACSSSLLAIHQACESIRKGECHYALAGGVNLSLHSYKYDTLTQMQMLASDGRCRTFGEGGDGYVPGEGVATVLLKPLSQALSDNDNIHGVIKAGAVNHNGKTNGFTVPNPVAQAAGFEQALNAANLSAADISYFEAHGTGTKLGDPIEFNALSAVFNKAGDNRCAIGSIKSNIGHLEGAAGVAALIKVLLQMKNNKIAASIHSQNPNPNLDLASSNLYVPQKLTDWSVATKPRRAAIASLGAGGANVYLIVEQHESHVSASTSQEQAHLFVFSAKSIKSLTANMTQMASFIAEQEQTLDPADVAFSLQMGRVALEHRLVVKATTLSELADKLEQITSLDLALDPLIGDCWYGYFANALVKGWQSGEQNPPMDIANMVLERIAQQWVDGSEINWLQLHQDQQAQIGARRVSLPTYQFEPTVYWPDISAEGGVIKQGQGQLSALLDANISSFGWQAFSKSFNRRQFYINTHLIGDQQIVAGAVLLEMAIEAFVEAYDLQIKGLRCSQLQWFAPAVVEQSIDTQIRLRRDDGRFEVARIDGDQYTSLFAGSVEAWVPIEHELVAMPQLAHLQALYQQVDSQSEAIYRYYAAMGLNYGDYFQVSHTVSVATNVDGSVGLKGLVELQPNSQSKITNATLEPSLLDGALRATLLVLRQQGWQQLLIPQSIAQVDIIQSINALVFAHVEIQHLDLEFQTYAEANITLYDQQGNVSAIIRGFRGVAATIVVETPAVKTQSPAALIPEQAATAQQQAAWDTDAALVSKAGEYLKQAFAQATGLNAATIKLEQSFDALAVDSITIVKLNKILDRDFAELSKTLFFECNSLANVLDYLGENHLAELYLVCDMVIQEMISNDRAATAVAEESPAQAVAVEPQAPSGNVFVTTDMLLQPLTDNPIKRQDKDVTVVFGEPDVAEFASLNGIAVKFGKTFRQYQKGRSFIIRPDRIDDLNQLLEAIVGQGYNPTVFAVFEPTELEWRQDDVLALSKTLDQQLKQSTVFIQALIKTLTLEYAQLQARVLHFSTGMLDSAQPQWQAYSGMANALADINNRLHFSAVNFHPANCMDWERYIDLIADEILLAKTAPNRVQYNAFGERFIERLIEHPALIGNDLAQEDLPLADKGVYLISGGAGGLGQVICRYLTTLAVNNNKQIAIGLLGRTPSNENTTKLAESLTNRSAKVFYAQTDIVEGEQLQQQLADIRETHGQIKGVIQCAGVSAGKGLLNASEQEFFAPMKAKCVGSVNLDQLTRRDPLDFFIMFSSITAHIGDFGAGAYAMANSFKDNYAYEREYARALGLCQGHTQSIGWPLWQVEGLEQNNEVVALYLEDYGLQAISESQGLAILRHCWASGQPHLAAYYGQVEIIADKLGLLATEELNQAANLTLVQEQADSLDVEDSSTKTLSVNPSAAMPSGYQSLFGAKADAKGDSVDPDIAVIGIDGVYPDAANIEQLWQNLCAGKDSISEIPSSRWDHDSIFTTDRDEKGKVYAKWGGFLEDVDQFDALQFSISPREAQLMDPQERLFLQSALHCMDDAGYSKSSLADSKVGVYVGVMWGQYQLFDIQPEQQQYGRPGSSFAAIANRVSYHFDFNGPSMSLDTMCSSSLTAIHLGRKSLLAGECDYVLAGGVNLSIHPDKYRLLAQGQFLASDGRCRAFGEGGDGYVPGEGVGVVMLKKLSRAIKDNDHIYGVLKGSAVNHGGAANAFTVPNPLAQGNVISLALAEADWDSSTISYVEAHGTGTSLGDPIEINGLERAYGKDAVVQSCAIGSIKSNIGHLESAAGIVGLTKVLLQMKHQQLAPSLHSETLNSNINFAKSRFKVNQELNPWEQPVLNEDGFNVTYPRRAGLSSFGAGGSNAHLLIEEYIAQPRAMTGAGEHSYLLPLSAKTEQRLEVLLQTMASFVSAQIQAGVDSAVVLADLAYTLQVGREHQNCRMAIVASSMQELEQALTTTVAGQQHSNCYQASNQLAQTGLEDILDQEQKNGLVETFIAKGNLAGLAQVWVNAMNIDWNEFNGLLFSAGRPARITVPGTPYVTESHWVDAKAPLASTAQGSVVTDSAGVLHPLLDKNLSTLFTQQYSKRMLGHEFYLRDHLVGQQQADKILPGVGYMEMARAAASEALGGSDIAGISNLMWLSPIVITDEPVDVSINISTTDKSLNFDVNTLVGGQDHRHAKGSVRLLEGERIQPESVDLEQLKATMTSRYEHQELYDYYQSIGFNFGPSFRVTQQVHSSATCAVTELSLPKIADLEFNDFYLHPSLMDGAIRSCLMVGERLVYDAPMVPFAVDDIEIYHPVNADCVAYVRQIEQQHEPATDAASGTQMSKKFDVTICSVHGEVLVEISGLQARQLTPPAATNHYYQRELQVEPLISTKSLSNEVILAVVGEHQGVVTALETLAINNTVIKVSAGQSQSFAQFDSTHYQIDLTNPAHYMQLCEQVAASGTSPTLWLNALSLSADASLNGVYGQLFENNDPKALLANVEQLLDQTTYSMVYLFQALMKSSLSAQIQGLYLHHSEDNAGAPHQLAHSAMAKSLLGLDHKFKMVTVGVDKNSMSGLATYIATELLHANQYGSLEVSYLAGERHVSRFVDYDPQTSATVQPAMSLNEGGCYLITGGLGKLGQLFARYLLQHWQAKVVLTGRSGASDKSDEILEQLTDDQSRVIYISSDLADPKSMASLFEQAKAKFGTIDGVLHSAGVVDENTIVDVDRAGFNRILEPKVQACINLITGCVQHKVDDLILFSSVSSFLGDLGGASYAYGNRFMDAMAELVAAHPSRLKLLAIDWPLWQTGGMQIPDEEIAFYRYSGMSPIEAKQGLEAFELALQSGLANIIVAPGNKAKIDRLLAIEQVVEKVVETIEVTEPAPVAVQGDSLAARLLNFVTDKMAGVINMAASKIEAHQSFQNYGMDSVMLMEFNQQLEQSFSGLSKTVLFEYDSLELLVEHLLKQHHSDVEAQFGGDELAPVAVETSEPKTQSVAASTAPTASSKVVSASELASLNKASQPNQNQSKRVAVIGMSGIFPGSKDLNQLWQNVCSGQSCISEIPAQRWQADDYFKLGKSNDKSRSCSKWGGFIDDVYHFDAPFFNISGPEAEQLDPQLRLMMKVAWQSVEDAGYSQQALIQKQLGVYIGVMNDDYTWHAADVYQHSGEYQGPGSFASEIANRISTMLNVYGPSLTVETACSSSTTAIHLARTAIINGECSMALAGGVNLCLHQGKYLMLDQMKVLAEDGLEKTFDDGANGLVPSEGVGAVLLKDYQQAIDDGDHIYGVICGSAIGHSGVGPAANLPSVRSLQSNIINAVESSDVDIKALSYIESHGTGTELGDPIELKALSNAFNHYQLPANQCAIGTKANFGHLEAASGVCSLIKVLTSFKHEKIGPCANLGKINSAFDLAASPFYFPNQLQDWETDGKSKLAGIHSFGLGGSNAFLLLESHQPIPSPVKSGDQLLVLSSNSAKQLKAQLQQLVDCCELETGRLNLADMAYTLQSGRAAYDARIAFVVEDVQSFVAQAKAYLLKPRAKHQGVYVPTKAAAKKACLNDEALSSALSEQNLELLAAHWVNGNRIDWSMLPQRSSQKCALPGYVFEEKAYRLTKPAQAKAKAKAKTKAQNKAPQAKVKAVQAPVLKEHLAKWYQQDKLTSLEAAVKAGQDYWQNYLQHSKEAKSLLNNHENNTPAKALKRIESQFEPALVSQMQQLSLDQKIEFQTLFVAAWSLILSRVTKSKNALFSIAGQFAAFDGEGDKLESVDSRIPLLIKTVMRLKVEQWLSELQQQLDHKFGSAHVPYDTINQWMGINDLCQSLMVFDVDGGKQGPGWLLNDLEAALEQQAGFTIKVVAKEQGLTVSIDYDPNKIEAQLAEQLLGYFEPVIESMVAYPQRNPAAIALITKEEQRKKFWQTLDK